MNIYGSKGNMPVMTPAKLRQISEQVVDILDKYDLSREEVRELLRAKGPMTGDERLGRVAEAIVALFIKEGLTIAECADVVRTMGSADGNSQPLSGVSRRNDGK